MRPGRCLRRGRTARRVPRPRRARPRGIWFSPAAPRCSQWRVRRRRRPARGGRRGRHLGTLLGFGCRRGNGRTCHRLCIGLVLRPLYRRPFSRFDRFRCARLNGDRFRWRSMRSRLYPRRGSSLRLVAPLRPRPARARATRSRPQWDCRPQTTMRHPPIRSRPPGPSNPARLRKSAAVPQWGSRPPWDGALRAPDDRFPRLRFARTPASVSPGASFACTTVSFAVSARSALSPPVAAAASGSGSGSARLRIASSHGL